MAFFKTSRVESNEVVKAEDISYNFDSQVSNFSVLLQGLVDNKHDFVVGGKVSVLSGMNLSIEPILGCCKETGICFVSTEKITEGIAVSTGESQDRIDIVQIKAIEEDYDEQQRSFIDFETKIETVQNVFTKKRVILQVEVKKGVAGSVVAPNTDTGFVKLAEIYVPANTLTIDEWGIYNITANYNGEDNTDWTNEKDRTYDFQYLSDLNKEFQSEHNKDGSHKNGVIGSDELDYGVGGKQINNAILPIGKNIAIDNFNYTATTQTATFLENLAQKISTIFSDYYNKGGKYNFNGELKISDLFSNNALTKPLRIKSDGKGFAYFYIGNKLIFTITESGLFQMPSGYNATATNEVVTKATTDAIIGQLSTINTKISEIETLINSNQEFVNSVFNRYTFSDKVITVATTANISLSGKQTIDGIALSVGNVVLVKNQTTAKQNGIYEVQTGAWNRLSGFTEFSSIKNKFFTITKGTANKGKVFFSPQEVCTLGTDSLIFKESFYKNLETKYTVPIRDSNGNIKTGTPSATNDAATKNYVDDAETSAKNLENATGVLAIAKGGTGATTQTQINKNIATETKTVKSGLSDGSLFVMKDTVESNTPLFASPALNIWNYIKGKISSVLGLTANSYDGTSKKTSCLVESSENTSSGIRFFQKPGNEDLMPSTAWHSLIRCQHGADDYGYYQDLAFTFDTDEIKYRRCYSKSLKDWKTIAFTDSTVEKATSDASGNNIADTYATKSVATTSTKGLMSSSDKSKLDGIEIGANKTTVDTALDSSSTNPVQNKVVNSALSNKVDKVSGKGLSTNDYTTAEKTKLAGLSNYTHPTDSGNKHIPSGGSSGQILRWSADGTAVWGDDYTLPKATTSRLGGVKRIEYPKVLTVPTAITPPEETTINITDTTAVSTVYNYSRSSSDDYPMLTINNNSSEIVSVGIWQSSSSFSSSKTVAPLIFGISCNRKEGSNNSVQDYEFTYKDIYLITPGESLKLNLSSSTSYNLVGIYKNGKLFI